MIGIDFIKALGESRVDYPHMCSTLITLYDGKDRIDVRDKIEYAEELFIKNPASKKRFLGVLNELEKEAVPFMDIKIDEHSVTIFYKSKREQSFPRKALVTPDYYMS